MKKKIIKYLTIIGTTALVVGVCSACGGENKSEGKLVGVKNVNLSVAEETYDFKAGVVGYIDGIESTFTCDTSDVEFGKTGVYTITYEVGNLTQTAAVKIYGAPNVSALNTEMSFQEAISGSTKDIVAVDSFGSELAVQYLGANTVDGYQFKYNGIYTANYSVTDIVGNTVEFSRKITVRGEKAQFGNHSIDLAGENLGLDIGEKDSIAVIYEDNKVYNGITQTDSWVYSFENLAAELGVGEHELILVTNEGYGDLLLTVTDNAPLAYEFDYGDKNCGINNYIFAQGENVYLPKLNCKKGTNQSFEAVYTLTKDGNDIAIDEFDSSQKGEYVYTAIVTRGGETTEVQNTFYIVSETEKLNYAFSTNSNQFITNYMPFYDYNSELDFVGNIVDENGEGYNALKFKNGTRSGHNRTLRMNTEILEQLLASGARTVSFKVMLAEEFSGPVNCFIFAYNSHWTCSNNNQFRLSSKKWTTLTFNLDSCWVRGAAHGVPNFYSTDYFGNISVFYTIVGLIVDPYGAGGNQDNVKDDVSVYIADVTFGESNDPSTRTYYDFTNGDNVIVGNGSIVANIAGESITYDKLMITENGIVKNRGDKGDNTLAWETLALVEGDILSYAGREFIAFEYNSGAIIGTGDYSLPRYGETLEKYGIDVKYQLFRTDNGESVAWNEDFFVATFNQTNGYNLRLSTIVNGKETVSFDNYFYVNAEDNTEMFPNKVTCSLLRYEGFLDVNGVKKHCFGVYQDGNPMGHKALKFSADILADALDNGATEIKIVIKTPLTIGQQVYRTLDGAVTYTNGVLVPSVDYYNVSAAQYGTWVTYTFKIDESMRGKMIGISLMKNAIIGDVYFA